MACLGVSLVAGAVVWDLLNDAFWSRHALITSISASLIVIALSAAVLNEVVERRDRRRWSLVAQSALFALIQCARLSWTSMIEVQRLAEVQSGSTESLMAAAKIAFERDRVSDAARQLLASPDRRQTLQRVVQRISEHYSSVIATWAPVMIGAAPYAGVLDRHVELQGRLEWVGQVLSHNEPPPDAELVDRRMTLASIASENADELDDDWIHDMLVAITVLAVQLDYESRELAFKLAPGEWWAARTRDLARPPGS